jgi:hypothetical protein
VFILLSVEQAQSYGLFCDNQNFQPQLCFAGDNINSDIRPWTTAYYYL